MKTELIFAVLTALIVCAAWFRKELTAQEAIAALTVLSGAYGISRGLAKTELRPAPKPPDQID